jgi:hypothetical protein
MMASKQVEVDPVTQNNMITWRAIAADLSRLQELELQYRNAIIPYCGFDAYKEEGSQTVSLGEGYKLELDRPIYYSVKGEQDVIMALINLVHENDPMAAIGLLRWKPEISVTQYRKLTDEQKRIIAPILDIKPGQASLKVVLPKESK